MTEKRPLTSCAFPVRADLRLLQVRQEPVSPPVTPYPAPSSANSGANFCATVNGRSKGAGPCFLSGDYLLNLLFGFINMQQGGIKRRFDPAWLYLIPVGAKTAR